MNFLAHFYLSGEDEGLILGNYLGDFLRGSELKNLPEPIFRGIELHRAIDEFTDAHELVKNSQNTLREGLGRYVPVAVDVIYDHFLAAMWKDYSKEKLQDFAYKKYQFLEKNKAQLNERALGFLKYMQRYNILFNYQFDEGIRKVFDGLNHRARFDTQLRYAVYEMNHHRSLLEADFSSFFPELIEHVRHYQE